MPHAAPRALALSFLLVALVGSAIAAECHGAPDPHAQPSTLPIYTDKPVLVKTVKNGKLFTVGDGDAAIPVVHLYGTPYEMGYAHGELMKDRAASFINSVFEYVESQIEDAAKGFKYTKWIPKSLVDWAGLIGLDAALDLTYDATKKYTTPSYFDEMRGLADAAGVDYKKIRRIHMIGELTKGGCSMFGAWGSAIPAGGSVLQMRALDWDIDGPFKNFPQLTVYHTTNTTGHDFVNVGWTGWIGSITGMSSEMMAISEIGVTFPDKTFGKDSRFGNPFTFLLRDILQFDRTIDDSISRISDTRRTCSLILGVGDGKLREFRGVQYSYSVANFIDDKNLRPVADWHPEIENVVYWGMDWLCPTYSKVLAAQLQKFHGNITAEVAVHDILPVVQTGDLHAAVYDLSTGLMHVSVAHTDSAGKTIKAYDRPFFRVDTKELFAEEI